MPVFSAAQLTQFAARLLERAGVPCDEADLVARSLVGANLRGHDSHGVVRVPQYVQSIEIGECRPGVPLVTLREGDVTLSTDGGWGLGQVQATRLTERVIAKALQHGIAIGTLLRSSHVGRLGEYSELAAAQGLASIAMVNTHGHARRVAPPGGTAPRLGTNPLAMGAPHPDGPLVLDFGTSATAEGKVRVKKLAGQTCPDGWLLDSHGNPTNDPSVLYQTPPGTILPMGGPQAYKGFGLALLVEIFSGALSGGPCIHGAPTTPNGNCLTLIVIDPGRLGGAEHFSQEVSLLTQFVRDCPRKDGVSEITLPGDPERRLLAERTRAGIPLDDGNWQALTTLAQRLQVTPPAA